jgi:hypothetical protein
LVATPAVAEGHIGSSLIFGRDVKMGFLILRSHVNDSGRKAGYDVPLRKAIEMLRTADRKPIVDS